jgi:hypothetical protein
MADKPWGSLTFNEREAFYKSMRQAWRKSDDAKQEGEIKKKRDKGTNEFHGFLAGKYPGNKYYRYQ